MKLHKEKEHKEEKKNLKMPHLKDKMEHKKDKKPDHKKK